MSKVSLPTFGDFYQAVHDREPFPWQERLADRVLESGWPEVLDLPTGTGKTTTLDIALYTLARRPEKLPRRVVLVVDRRVVVDQGARDAQKLRRKLFQPEAPPIKAVSTALRTLWDGDKDEPPFAIATMRGGMPRDNDWAKRPDQPVLGVSTIDQLGSRLLFRGYGISARSASIHAGLLGNDTLILLDEVHLATAFAQTLDALRERWIRPKDSELPDRFVVVKMSATPNPGQTPARPFALDRRDRAHPVLAQRLGAKKPAKLVTVDVRGDNETNKLEALAERAVAAALELQSQGAKIVGIVVNRVDTARHAARVLADEHAAQTSALLVTGRMRPIDRDAMVREHFAKLEAGRVRADDKPLIVVATQCIEAGADLDFDALVTECASLDALRQRFGRLDRFGEVTKDRGGAPAVILARSDLVGGRAKEDPVYGDALRETWKWLQEQAKKDGVGFGIDELNVPEGNALTPLLAKRAEAPVLLPSQLDAWSHTSPVLEPWPDPDPALWLHGPQRSSGEVQVIWRADLLEEPPDDDEEKAEHEGREPRFRDVEVLKKELAAVRPSSLEAMTLPGYAVRAWLARRPRSAVTSDVLAEQEDDEWRHDDATLGRPYLRVRRGKVEVIAGAVARPRSDEERAELHTGDIILVPSSYGGISPLGTFDPAAKEPVIDVGDLAQLRARGRVTLRLRPEVLRVWGIDEELRVAAPSWSSEEEQDSGELRTLLQRWIDRWPKTHPPGFRGESTEWQAVLESSPLRANKPSVTILDDNKLLAVESHRDAKNRRGKPVRGDEPELVSDAITEDDDSSFRGRAELLERHSQSVRKWAKDLASRIGFPQPIIDDLALAAWLHDVGKADPRFQRMLLGGDAVRASMQAKPLAKSSLSPDKPKERALAHQRAGYPAGYRHELLSLAMIQDRDELRAEATDYDLVMHLVASHHGWCRPHPPPVDPGDAPALEVTLEHGEHVLRASTSHLLAQANSGVAQRYCDLVERYGWWGLAWLEAVMRLADHRASEEAEEGSTSI